MGVWTSCSRVLVGTAAVAVLASGCGSIGDRFADVRDAVGGSAVADDAQPGSSAGSGHDAEGDTARAAADDGPVEPASPALTEAPLSRFDTGGQWSFVSGMPGGPACLFGDREVACLGTAAPGVPELTTPFRMPPNSVWADVDTPASHGLFEGNQLSEAVLQVGEYVVNGQVRCERPERYVLRCAAGANGFSITGPEHLISLTGGARGGAEQNMPTRGSSGSSGSGVDGRLAAPACDGRGILILESVLVPPGGTAEPLIRAALGRHPGTVYAAPGHCPSLRAPPRRPADLRGVPRLRRRYRGALSRGRGHRRQRSRAQRSGRVPQPLLAAPQAIV